MAAVQVSLLVIAVAGVFAPRISGWVVPAGAAATLLLVGGIGLRAAGDTARSLLAPLAFLLLAVPLAIMLDRLGFFSSVAALVDHGRNPRLGLWVLAAATTTLLNLDASVVLLTPLYVRVARRHGLDPMLLAFQPVLLAALASSALPISNLTNLIAADDRDLRFGDFLLHLGPASLAATVVGWLAYDRLPDAQEQHLQYRDPVESRALWLGTPVVAILVLGFTAGDAFGIKAWVFALIADLILLPLTRDLRIADFPFGAAALAVSLGIVATSAAPHLGLNRLFAGDGCLDQLQAAAVAGVGADTINNLPALLVGLRSLGSNDEQVWPLLFGVNFAPIFVLHGALAGLLWRGTLMRLGIDVGFRRYSSVGLRVGLPSVAAGLVIVLLTDALTG